MSMQARNHCLDYLINPIFQGVNTFFVLSFENETNRIECTGYYLPKVEIRNYNVMITGGNFLDQSIIFDIKT